MDSTYIFLQHYWWFLVSLLGALLVFLLFVQGGNSLLFCLGRTEEERTMLVNSTGRKWEFTFTTLVTFGGAFFASFPLFYSTSFGGAYWLWMIILFSFVLQAVSYEFQSKLGNWLGKRTYQYFLILNGVVGPLLLGAAVATFFTGSNFVVSKANLTDEMMPVISHWANGWHGLDAFANPWNLVLGLAVFFLARLLGNLYFINNIRHDELVSRCRRQLITDAVPFLIFFLAFVVYVLVKDGFAVDAETGQIVMEPYKYLNNLLAMPYLLVLFLVGVLGVLFGLIKSIFCKTYTAGIWFAGIGTVLTVLALLLTVGYNNTAYYPSAADLQSSLTISNSCSSLFTLKTMAYVSILVPFVLAYIIYAWRAIDRKPISMEELKEEEHLY
ncbi:MULTISPECIES: cytochrome d ubiquinol oxidase subunit II [Bacteroides]|uniref:Cytochrome d ubiquinol oxidase subunit II n=2 Tax=Bacteroidaceae TaxID=815 RepID=A0ABT7VCC5_9BACE|nr:MULTISPECIES: cytochrome d ubiquinol oxidase subunit II [Bacteroides]MBU3856462.1 cytochrome d ubiquinol oxidase subunit II [Candidatus Phocaeicola excrementipullorum]MBW9198490.1 cytochrome d ubiquinol oxidase subunit II [Bacteroidales bacterium SW299]MCR8917481.1 cytochrome d ubiquinol oxidase subunit II [Bacteroides sp. ET225]MDM8207100.1 cytochrome d ubiquinol oxidase subunit II [Bacteroides gallinaceum]MDM8323947.1 cytochrome d ubiquinol oxidase subunit II [Bacteroides gallinaceum]